MAAPRHQGAAHARRRPRQGADGDARRARRAAGRRPGSVRLQIEQAERIGQAGVRGRRTSRKVVRRPTVVVRDFSTRIMRGDRIGLIGPNGAGKTTLLRLLLGELPPDAGEVRRGANVQVAYFDQQREQLDPERTVVDTIGDGNDTRDGQRPAAPRARLPAGLPVSARARPLAGEGAVGRRAQPAAAGAAVHAAGQRAGARRADQRSRSRDAGAARRAAGRVAGHAAARQPRSRFLDNVVTSTLAFEGDGASASTSAATRTGCASRAGRLCRALCARSQPRPRQRRRHPHRRSPCRPGGRCGACHEVETAQGRKPVPHALRRQVPGRPRAPPPRRHQPR